MISRFKDFDLYRKIPKDLTESSSVSTLLSMFAALCMLVLFVAELWAFLTIGYETQIIIDQGTDPLLRINFNLTLLDVPCEYATIDVVDVLGTRSDNVTLNVNKWAVDREGLRRGYEGRNVEQNDIMHDVHHDLELLHANGVHAVPLNQDSFEGWLQHHDYVFVNFYAPWCVWCQRLHPVWEAFAEQIEVEHLPFSVVQVDCVENRDLCMREKIQAFPTLRVFQRGVALSPDYRSDRTVSALTEYAHNLLAHDEQLALLSHDDRQAHEERKEAEKNDHPGCMMSGFLLVNKVPGNFHIEMRSKHHNINPTSANLSHIVHSLSFGPVLPKTAVNRLAAVPREYFRMESTHPMNENMYANEKLHQSFHHYIKVVNTEVEVGLNEPVQAFQMVQSSQIMQYNEEDVPEARFSYDLSPMSVHVARRGKKWYQFLTSMCALVGGTFTVMGLLSGVLSMLFKPKKL